MDNEGTTVFNPEHVLSTMVRFIFFILSSLVILSYMIGGLTFLVDVVYPLSLKIVVFCVCLGLIVGLVTLIRNSSRRVSALTFWIMGTIVGFHLWLYSLIVVSTLWGAGWAFVGLCILGVGNVPISLLASLFMRDWNALGTVVLLIVVLLVFRGVGIAIGVWWTQTIIMEYEKKQKYIDIAPDIL